MNFSINGIQPLIYPGQLPSSAEPERTRPDQTRLAQDNPGQTRPDPTRPNEDKADKNRPDTLGKKGDGSEECQTCKNRKYQDGSDEMVSFKSAAHIAPGAAASVVRAHEQEHVSNAYAKAATNNGKVIRASVSLHTAICPECGRSYISGGTTNTQIKYYNEENPYQQELKSADRAKYSGRNIDYAV